MIYERDKDEYIYSLKYDKQTIYYFDDSLFQGEEPNNNFNKESICKISDINDYIEEFSKFFDIEYFTYKGLLKIPYKRENINLENLPIICNSKNQAARLHTNFVSHKDVSGKEFFDSTMSIVIDVTKSFNEIMSDLEILEDLNEEFELADLLENIGVISMKNFHEYISAERLFMLEKEEYAFILLEYCQLRKYMGLGKESAKKCLKTIYNFEKES